MLEWEQRIGLCRLLLTEMIDLSRPNEEDLGRHLEALDAYLTSGEFHAKDKKMKENETICMLGEVIIGCCHVYENICRMAESAMEASPRKMTMDEVKAELSKAYADAIEMGDGEFLSTNVNDWIRENGIEIVKKKGRPRKTGAARKPGRPRKSGGLRQSRQSGKEE